MKRIRIKLSYVPQLYIMRLSYIVRQLPPDRKQSFKSNSFYQLLVLTILTP